MSEGPKCERCREYNAAAVDYRNEAANLRADLAALLARHNALVEAVVKYLGASDTADMAAIEDALTVDMLSNTVTARAEVDKLLGGE